jgi:hypothetical protein
MRHPPPPFPPCRGRSNQMSGPSLIPLLGGALAKLTALDIRGCPRACGPAAFHHLSRLTALRSLR